MLVVAAIVASVATLLLNSPVVKAIPLLGPFAILTVLMCFLLNLKGLLSTNVLLADTVSAATQDQISAQDASISIWSGPTMQRVGVLILIDVPDNVGPHDVAKMMPQVIDSGFEIFDGSGTDEGTHEWEQRRLFVLDDKHRQAFETCLTHAASNSQSGTKSS